MTNNVNNDLLDEFLKNMTFVENLSRKLGIASIEYDDGLVLSSLSYVTGLSGGKIFIDAGAGVGHSTLWILYGVLKAFSREKIFIYAIEKDPYRYKYLRENLEKSKNQFQRDSFIEINNINEDAIKFLHEKNLVIDMIFVDNQISLLFGAGWRLFFKLSMEINMTVMRHKVLRAWRLTHRPGTTLACLDNSRGGPETCLQPDDHWDENINLSPEASTRNLSIVKDDLL
jgi:hypothetical protein